MKRCTVTLSLWVTGALWAQSPFSFPSTERFVLDHPYSLGHRAIGYLQTPNRGGKKNGGVHSLSVEIDSRVKLFINFDAFSVTYQGVTANCRVDPSSCMDWISYASAELSFLSPTLETVLSCHDRGEKALLQGMRADKYGATEGATAFQTFLLEALFNIQNELMVHYCSCWTEKKRVDQSNFEEYRSCKG